MQQKNTQRMIYAFGISMATIMALSLILPAISSNLNNSQPQPQDTAPTATAVVNPTPLPITDFSSIIFEEDYLHPSGLYSVEVPTGWVVLSSPSLSTQTQTTLSNFNAQSEIYVYIEKPSVPITTMEELSAYFSGASLSSSWRAFGGGVELLFRDEVDGKLIVDFALDGGDGTEYLAQHTAWFDEDWIYVVRIFVPSNASELLFHMRDMMVESIHTIDRFNDTPVVWQSYYDFGTENIMRFPPTWRVSDGGLGLPISIESVVESGVRVRMEAQEGNVADEDAARAWVEDTHDGIEVASVAPTTHENGGFSVAYNYTDADGNGVSGLVVLFNGMDEQLHIAELQIPDGGVDLNSDEARETYGDATMAMDTFSMLSGLNFPQIAGLN
jgi:hypothetical protein